MNTNYYTYAYLRKDRTPYYIGKGSKNRAYNYHGKRIKVPPKDRILILKYFLKESDAYNHEIYMIGVFGRKDLGTGILINMTNGGDNPPKATGRVGWNRGKTMNFSKERGEKISKALKGKPKSKEHREKLSKSRLGVESKFKNKFKINDIQVQELILSENILELSKKWNVTKDYLYGLRKTLKKRGYDVNDARNKSEKKINPKFVTEEQLSIIVNAPKSSLDTISKKLNLSKTYIWNLRYKYKKRKRSS